jgi:hypothetical protein
VRIRGNRIEPEDAVVDILFAKVGNCANHKNTKISNDFVDGCSFLVLNGNLVKRR